MTWKAVQRLHGLGVGNVLNFSKTEIIFSYCAQALVKWAEPEKIYQKFRFLTKL